MNYFSYKLFIKAFGYTIITSLVVCFIIGCNNHSIKENNIGKNNIKEATSQVRFIGQWLNEGKREKLVRDFTRKYEFENQDVDVVLKFPEEVYFDRSDQLSNQKFIAEIMSKSNPEWDIIRLNNQYKEVVAICNDSAWAKKYLVDFSEYPDFNNNTLPELLTKKIKDSWGGIIPGPFIEGQYWALWTNKKVTDKIGIEVKQYGMTVDDFIGYIKAVNTYNKNNPSDYIIPIQDATDWRIAYSIAFNIYISALNEPNLLFSIGQNEKKLVAWHKTLEVLEELAKYEPYNRNWNNLVWSDTRFDLINEKCLFYPNGAWMYNIWNGENASSTVNCFPNQFPVLTDAKTYPSSYQIMWGVLKNSPNKEKAVKFLLAMNTPDIAEMWVQYTKCPTGIKGKLTDISFGSDQFEEFSFQIQKMYGNNTYHYSEDLCRFIIGDNDNRNTYYRDVLLGNMTADEAMRLIRQSIRKW